MRLGILGCESMAEQTDQQKLLVALYEKILARETESFKEMVEMKLLLKRILLQMIKLNSAMNILNYISGANPKIPKTEIEREMNLAEEYEKELRERLDKFALEFKG